MIKIKPMASVENKNIMSGKLHVQVEFQLKEKKYDVPFMKHLDIMNQRIPVSSMKVTLPP